MPSYTEVMSAASAAHTVGVSVRTVRRWIDAGEIVPVGKLSGRNGAYLIDARDVATLARLHRDALAARVESIDAALAGSTAEAVAS